ncbi:DUF695 domain-containing protein [Prosthecomicrobium hirschii]|uniref:DUF695 domain-containing protein n=1 Tax=Prosthecodimorpha hirschii TaxID=665126 RepID=UPI002220337A|nr:DUF695 domain-containing protein [Prosthecomicrobium hirschii]MCW1840006.1 DUF695 domain-containing protein [Prosthecomicrobium hirschii]
MSDRWNFYPLMIEDKPASIFVDLGINELVPVAGFPTMAFLSVRMREPRDDGLSSQAEYETLMALEDTIFKFAAGDDRTLYVGRSTSDGCRDFYFYTRDAAIENNLRRLMQNWPQYAFETGTRLDAEWTTYSQFLYPSAEDLQLIGNRDVVYQLQQNGDHSDCPRPIDHFAVFRTVHDRDAYGRFLVTDGFSISDKPASQDGRFGISFSRSDRPDQIDPVTIGLYRAALEHNGDYDGWGCAAVIRRPTP